LPKEIQERFHYDPAAAAQFNAAVQATTAQSNGAVAKTPTRTAGQSNANDNPHLRIIRLEQDLEIAQHAAEYEQRVNNAGRVGISRTAQNRKDEIAAALFYERNLLQGMNPNAAKERAEQQTQLERAKDIGYHPPPEDNPRPIPTPTN
jgi:hypothetical protein